MLEPKRKNEDKRKSVYKHPTFWVTTLMIVIIGMVGFVFYRMMPLPSPYPAARLTYISDGAQYALDLRTGQYTRANFTPNPYYPPSPDGRWRVYRQVVTEFYEWDLLLEDLQSQQTTLLKRIRGSGTSISWSADSQWMAFNMLPEDMADDQVDFSREELYLIHIGTGEFKRLTHNGFPDSDPAFSPDGTQIAYTSAADGINRLYIMDVASGESRLITPDMHGYSAAWSPDGRWIAFMTTHLDYNGDIWIIRADGTDAQAITNGTRSDIQPLWLP